VEIETGAGAGAGFGDRSYVDAGATVVAPGTGWDADLVATIDLPSTPVNTAVIGLLAPFDGSATKEALERWGATGFAFEAVPRTSRAQMIDALSSQATAAGYQAVLEAAHAADSFFPMLTTAAGTIRPAKVVVLGAGVAGLQAIATARRLGGAVSAFDVRSAAAEQVRSLGAAFIDIDWAAQDESESGGYAREVGEDERGRLLEALRPHITAADAVIATAAIPGQPAPILIDDAMVAAMRPGSVIVDLAASTGGNCTATVRGSTVVRDGVTIIGDTDLVSRVAADASRMYARNVAAFVELITGEDGAYAPDWDDEIVAGTCIAREGRVVHPLLVGAVT